MNEERKHEILSKSTYDELSNYLRDWVDIAKKLEIDLNDKGQADQYVECRSVSKLIEVNIFLERMKIQQKERRKIHIEIQLLFYRHEFDNLMNKCDRFPKWIRIKYHRKQIEELSQKIRDYSNNEDILQLPVSRFDAAIASLERAMDIMYESFRTSRIFESSIQGKLQLLGLLGVESSTSLLSHYNKEQQKGTELENDGTDQKE